MLVLCVGMYRACSTWQYGVVGSILEKHRSGRRLGFVEGIYFQDKVDPSQLNDGWSVLKAHDAHRVFDELLSGSRAIGFYSYRDLRDVVFSYMHKTGTDFDALMERGFIELCLNNDRFWRAQPGMLVQSYDDLIANPAQGVEQIADHLGVALEPGEAQAIADSMSWESNRRKVESLADRLRTEGTTLSADDQSRFDPVSLLHWNHIRPASPGDRQKAGTTRQCRVIERSCRPWLVSQGFEPREMATVEAVEDAGPVIRTSYDQSGVDIRLDRLFRGIKGSLIDFDASFPVAVNSSYYFYVRGWRSINIGTTYAPRDRFVVERPNDLNLACRFDPVPDEPDALDDSARVAAEQWANFVTSHRVPPPEFVIFNLGSDVDRLVGLILGTSWRPKVFVVADLQADAEMPAWRTQLDQLGYLTVPVGEGPKFYLRADLAHELPTLACPLSRDDQFHPAEPMLSRLDLEAEPSDPEEAGEPTASLLVPCEAVTTHESIPVGF